MLMKGQNMPKQRQLYNMDFLFKEFGLTEAIITASIDADNWPKAHKLTDGTDEVSLWTIDMIVEFINNAMGVRPNRDNVRPLREELDERGRSREITNRVRRGSRRGKDG